MIFKLFGEYRIIYWIAGVSIVGVLSALYAVLHYIKHC